MSVAVRDLRPNPFRDLERYPIDADKVTALIQSIRDTQFWDNLLARKSENGAYELAYGVHRLQALKKASVEEVDIPIRKLDDETMIKIMAHENQAEWKLSALVEQETIRAIVLAFGDGKIELPKTTSGRTSARIAPSFVVSDKSERLDLLYTAATISKFLGGDKAGWPDSKVETILGTLAVMEKGLVEREDLEDLTTYQAEQVARQANRVEKETGDKTLAKNIGKKLGAGMRKGAGTGRPGRGGKPKGTTQAISLHGAKRAADTKRVRPVSKLHTIEEVAETLNASSRTVRRLIESGDLPVHRFGRLVRISGADLAAFLAANRSV